MPSDKIPAVEHETLVIDNTQCRFVPHAAVATVGSTIEAVNSDSVLHTTHLYGPVESNISLPIEGARAERTFRRPGLVVVKCDIHGWMQAFIRVDEHPFHAVTDDDGVFAIRNIPPGTYTLDVWHERLGRRTESVTILPGETTHVELPFP